MQDVWKTHPLEGSLKELSFLSALADFSSPAVSPTCLTGGDERKKPETHPVIFGLSLSVHQAESVCSSGRACKESPGRH